MVKKSIGLIGYSPASVNALKPLIDVLWLDFDIRLIVLSDFAEKEWKIYIADEDIEVYKYFNDLDLIIYNTGSGGTIETDVPLEAKELGISCLSIQDIFWDNKENYKRRFKNIPDYLVMITEENKSDLLDVIEINEENVKVLGNPHFDRLKNFKYEEDDYLSVCFLSQCGTGGGLNEPTDENCKEALYELINLLNKGIITSLKIFRHPRENLYFYKELGIYPEKTNDFEDMMRNGIIVSCGSTPHYEAMLLGKKTLFSGRGGLEKRILNEEWDNLNLGGIEVGNSTYLIINYIKEILS